MRCCICARDCKASTTNLRKNEEPNMRWKKMIFIAPLAILAMLLFIFIGGEIVLHLWNWRLPPDQLLASLRPPVALPHPLRRIGTAQLLWAVPVPPSDGRALRSHHARRARTIPPTHARALRLRP